METRQAAIEWAQKMLQRDCLVLDTETTGLGRGDGIVQIGIIDSSGKIVLDQLINPGLPIPPEATAIHGITDADVEWAPSIADVPQDLDAILRGRTVVIYNSRFDIRMLSQSYRNAGLDEPTWWNRAVDPEGGGWHCAMLWYSSYKGNSRYRKLTDVACSFHLPTSEAHGAIGDCIMTLGVVKWMAATQ